MMEIKVQIARKFTYVLCGFLYIWNALECGEYFGGNLRRIG
jgi:hypothetical protein